MAILNNFYKHLFTTCLISILFTYFSHGNRIKRNLNIESSKNEILQSNTFVDQSETVFASYDENRDSWLIVKDVNDWLYNDTIGAQAKFMNKQLETGWMFLNVETKEEFSDEKQAYAAGLLEGYLTGVYIVEQYKEFYANDVCKSHPDLCEWVKERVRENNDWIEGTQYVGTITMNLNQRIIMTGISSYYYKLLFKKYFRTIGVLLLR